MYSKSEKEAVLAQYHASGLSKARASRELPGFPDRKTLASWLREESEGLLDPPELHVRGRAEHRKHRRYPEETRREAVRLVGLGVAPSDVARRLGVACAGTVRSWASAARRGSLPAGPRAGAAVEARGAAMAADGRGGAEQTDWRDWAADLPEDPAERARAAERKLIEAGAVLDVLKAPGPGSLTNGEKRRAGQAARAEGVRLADVCADLAIPKSTYCAQAKREAAPDKHAALRRRVRLEFERSGGVYGPEPITAALRRPAPDGRPPVKAAELGPEDDVAPVVVSEKVVRRIMAEEGLVPAQTRSGKVRYDSYKGELAERPANLPLRGDGTHDFHAGAPFELVVTDVTMFHLDGFKCYLSPVVDCFDGCPVAWGTSRRPDDDLTLGPLREAREKAGHGFAAHTDGGGNYMSGRWVAYCAENGIERSMSRKGRSPDNARAEGFFGTLKKEFFHCRDWTGVGYDEFVAELDRYIEWYRDKKLKKSLGWRTIREVREEMGVAV